jgi:hypothetical protein
MSLGLLLRLAATTKTPCGPRKSRYFPPGGRVFEAELACHVPRQIINPDLPSFVAVRRDDYGHDRLHESLTGIGPLVDRRTDIWAFGVVLCPTGEHCVAAPAVYPTNDWGYNSPARLPTDQYQVKRFQRSLLLLNAGYLCGKPARARVTS